MSIQHNYTYQGALDAAHKVQWKVDDLIGDDKPLDFSRPFLPDSLARTRDIRSLNEREKLILNHIRGASYLHLFGLVEEFILPFAIDRARDGHAEDKLKARAFLVFAEEEAKHQQLFQRFAAAFKAGFKTPIEFIGPASAIAGRVLAHSTLAVAILILHLEWLTQRHYLESIKSDARLDPRFVDLLKHHWQEEAQHAKLDTLLAAELAAKATPEEIEKAIDDFLAIGGLLDGGLQAQVELDIDALQRAIGRALSDADKEEVRRVQLASYRYTFLVSGLDQEDFVRAVRGLSAAGAERVHAVARALS